MNDTGNVISLAGRFEMHVRRQIAEWVQRDPSNYDGWEWWQLTVEEEAVFAIDRDRFPVMACAMFAYEVFKGIAQVDDFGPGAVLHDARLRFPEWARPKVIDLGEFTAFAGHFCGLTAREAHAIYWKHEFWHVRSGISVFDGEQ
jgi:hypothetical protein